MNIIDLVGQGEDLTIVQMCIRGFFMFFFALILMRLGSIRILGERTAFDTIVMFLLGSILARGVVGASPYWATICTAALIILIHSLLGKMAVHSDGIDRIIKGDRYCLYKNGKINQKHLKYVSISENDLLEGIRQQTNKVGFEEVDKIYMERNGKLTIIEKDSTS